MRLKSGMVMRQIGDQYIAVATGEAGAVFTGMIRSNKTADLILHELVCEKTEDELVEAVTNKFDVSREQAREGVRKVVCVLRDEGLLND